MGFDCFTYTASKGLSERVTPRIESRFTDTPNPGPFSCVTLSLSHKPFCSYAGLQSGTTPEFPSWITHTLSWLTTPTAVHDDSAGQLRVPGSGQDLSGHKGLLQAGPGLESLRLSFLDILSFHAAWSDPVLISGHTGCFHSLHLSGICLLSHLLYFSGQ